MRMVHEIFMKVPGKVPRKILGKYQERSGKLIGKDWRAQEKKMYREVKIGIE